MVEQSSNHNKASQQGPQNQGNDPFATPEMLEMQRKMRKFTLWSLVIMILGISSVVGVLIYKSMSDKESAVVAVDPSAPVTHMLRTGESVRSMIVENGLVYLLVDGAGMTSVIRIDKKTGAVDRRIEFIPQGN